MCCSKSSEVVLLVCGSCFCGSAVRCRSCAEVVRQALASLPLEGFSSLLQAGLLEGW